MGRLRVLACAALTGLMAVGTAHAEDADLAPKLRAALVRVHATSQVYETAAPWKLGQPFERSGRGVVVGPGQILCRAATVANQRMIEIELANSARRYPGTLTHVDRDTGLAIVGYDDEHLKGTLVPLPLGNPITLDDACDIYQLGRDNLVERYDARVLRASADTSGLELLVKTNCSDGGDGQAAVKDGAFVGLVIGTFGSRQQGTILAIETIRQYLEDVGSEAYRGRPGAGFWTHQLLRQDLRTYYGLAENQHGLGVSRVVPGRTGDGVLKDGDALLAIDGYDLDDEGKFVHEVHGRLGSGYLLGGRRLAGDVVKARVLRDGVELDVAFPLVGQPARDQRVPDAWEMERPQFMVVGGLVLLELTSGSGISRSDGGVLLRRFRERAHWDPPTKRRRLIYLDRVLQDVVTKGFEDFYQQPIRTINGIEILDFQSVPRALETPEGAFHVFRFDGLVSDIAIPAAELDAINARVAEKYKVTRLRYLHGDPE
ncbi:MAG: hypothetical protein O2894_11300 [Planctomycetota bacterium]|nr:hypothetical protein [Planctomycetota bacterium]